MNKPRILCVDDEPSVLEGLALQLRRLYDVRTATSPKAALEELSRSGPFQAVLSDMRMPGGSGADFLAQVRARWPGTIRLLLTGQADVESAIEAVNEGQVFRFLTKPCPPTALKAAFEAAVEQRRLVTAEKELIGKTLRGSLQALMEVLSLAQPETFGRADRIKARTAKLAARLVASGVPAFGWELDMAALLCLVGSITLPPELARKARLGEPLSREEDQLVLSVPGAAAQILSHIPRLETVSATLKELARLRRDGAGAGSDNRAAALLRLVLDADDAQSRGLDAAGTLQALAATRVRHDPGWISQLESLLLEEERARIVVLPLNALAVGMALAEDIKTPQGTLLVARGFEITPNLLERLHHMPRTAMPDGFRVRLPLESGEAPGASGKIAGASPLGGARETAPWPSPNQPQQEAA